MSSAEFRQFQDQLAKSVRQASELADDRLDDTAAQLIRGLAFLAQHTAKLNDQIDALKGRVAELEGQLARAGSATRTTRAGSDEPQAQSQ